jgi:hypothetical protein
MRARKCEPIPDHAEVATLKSPHSAVTFRAAPRRFCSWVAMATEITALHEELRKDE